MFGGLIGGTIGGLFVLSLVISAFISSMDNYFLKLLYVFSITGPIGALIIGIVSSINPGSYDISYTIRLLLISIGSCFLFTIIIYHVVYFTCPIFSIYVLVAFISSMLTLLVLGSLAFTHQNLVQLNNTIRIAFVCTGSIVLGLGSIIIGGFLIFVKIENDRHARFLYEQSLREKENANGKEKTSSNKISETKKPQKGEFYISILPRQDLEMNALIELLEKYSKENYWVDFNKDDFLKQFKKNKEYVYCINKEDKLYELKEKMMNDEINCLVKNID